MKYSTILILSLVCFVIFAFLPITLYYKTIGCVISLVGAIYGFMNTFRRIDDDEYPDN
jgi:hypothetical protein